MLHPSVSARAVLPLLCTYIWTQRNTLTLEESTFLVNAELDKLYRRQNTPDKLFFKVQVKRRQI